MLKEVLVIKITLGYPPHGEFKQYKKGTPRPRHKATNKRGPCIQYNRNQEQASKEIFTENGTTPNVEGPRQTRVRQGDPSQRRGRIVHAKVRGGLQDPPSCEQL